MQGPAWESSDEHGTAHKHRETRDRAALRNLWVDGDVSPETFLRIERAAEGKLARKRSNID